MSHLILTQRACTAECEKVVARYADDPDMMLTSHEREAIRVVRAILTGVADADKERDAR